MSDDPMLWKELYAEPGYRLHPLAHGLLTLAMAAFLIVAMIGFMFATVSSLVFPNGTSLATIWLQIFGTLIGSLMIVAVAVVASTSLGRERERRTLDSLLTTPLTNVEIIRGKWLGALLSVRPAWWFLGGAWLLATLAGGMHLLSVLLLLAAWWVFASYAAALGFWFSLRCRTTIRATVWTLIALLLIGAVGAMMSGSYFLAANPATVRVGDFAMATPPGVMVRLTFGWEISYSFDSELGPSLREVGAACLSVLGYGVVALILWLDIHRSFGPITGRG